MQENSTSSYIYTNVFIIKTFSFLKTLKTKNVAGIKT